MTTHPTTPNQSVPRVLEGRLGFVTGAGQGIGRAIALGLSQAGARVIVTDMNEANARETADAVRAQGGTAWSSALDVRQSHACQALAARIGAVIGPVDLLVNNAGINISEGIDSPNAERNWHRVFDVNVNGTFNVTQAFLADIRSRRGTIVNMASRTSFVAQAGSIGYSPSKGDIKMFTQTLAAELAKDGVRVNAIAPGLIATPMNVTACANPGYLENHLPRIPMGRIGEPVDLVGPTVFLSSSMSSYVTGVTLVVDGGYLAT